MNQHGLTTGKSSVLNLCTLIDHVAEAIVHKKKLDVIYTDVERTFHKIDLQLLLNKLMCYGISSKSLILGIS